MTSERSARMKVLVAGGGIAGLEALLALHDLGGDRVELTMLSPNLEFSYRPMIVEEAFSNAPADRRDLQAICDDLDTTLVRGSLEGVRPDEHVAVADTGAEIPYDAAIICVGAGSRPAYKSASALRTWAEPVLIDEALASAAFHESRTLAFVVPPATGWPLPLYELAMFASERARERDLDVALAIYTPEARPLTIFGEGPSQAVADLLEARKIAFHGGISVAEESGRLVCHPGGKPLDAGKVVALPVLGGSAVRGLPADAEGFIPIGAHAEVVGVPDLFAAGDCTNFPIKQGGIGTQQADAAAEAIAARAGAKVDPGPFKPVLRGKLIMNSESLSMTSGVVGGSGEGTVGQSSLWWPPMKVAGRYLAPYLEGTTSVFAIDPGGEPIDVTVALPGPGEWHAEPMALDPEFSRI